ncbi:MAG TPA: DUF3592 domain-containing protein, partial [Polyangiales bacterium]|nr:DUF3592 domain-containing protein [Polyangiales bacterium]
AAFGGVQHARVVAFGARTNGTIVGYNEKHDTTYKRRGTSSSRTTYAPVVRFDLAGNSYTFEHWWSRNSPPTIGAPVFVRYDSTHPEHAMIDDGMRLWIPWAPLFALGALLMFDALRRWLARLRSG